MEIKEQTATAEQRENHTQTSQRGDKEEQISFYNIAALFCLGNCNQSTDKTKCKLFRTGQQKNRSTRFGFVSLKINKILI